MTTYVITGLLAEEFKQFLAERHNGGCVIEVNTPNKLLRMVPVGVVRKTLNVVAKDAGFEDGETLLKKTNIPIYARNRGIAIYLLRKMTDMSMPEIGRMLGMHHTTVLYWNDKIRDERQTDEVLSERLNWLQAELEGEHTAEALEKEAR